MKSASPKMSGFSKPRGVIWRAFESAWGCYYLLLVLLLLIWDPWIYWLPLWFFYCSRSISSRAILSWYSSIYLQIFPYLCLYWAKLARLFIFSMISNLREFYSTIYLAMIFFKLIIRSILDSYNRSIKPNISKFFSKKFESSLFLRTICLINYRNLS